MAKLEAMRRPSDRPESLNPSDTEPGQVYLIVRQEHGMRNYTLALRLNLSQAGMPAFALLDTAKGDPMFRDGSAGDVVYLTLDCELLEVQRPRITYSCNIGRE